MIKFIRDYFRKREQTKAYNKIKAELLGDNKKLLEMKAKHEAAFGKDSQTRTAKQWTSLVRVYGIEQVMKSEKMTAIQVNQNCNEKFASKFLKAQRN